MIAAAALAIATGVASAQSMKANIHFSFRFGNEVYSAGIYQVDVQNGYHLVRLSNWETKQNGLLLTSSMDQASPQWRANGEPVIAFECGLSRCQLVRVWTGDERPAVSLPHPRMNRDEAATLRLIHLSRLNGD
jgi:hypothetical protein